jgi:hypothetical protein
MRMIAGKCAATDREPGPGGCALARKTFCNQMKPFRLYLPVAAGEPGDNVTGTTGARA